MSKIIMLLLLRPVSYIVGIVFALVDRFFSWVSEGITNRLIKRKIPPEKLQTLRLPEREEEIAEALHSPQIVLLADWIQLRNRVNLLLRTGLFVVLIPSLLLMIHGTRTIRLGLAGSFFVVNGLGVLTTWFGTLRPISRFAVELEKYPELAIKKENHAEMTKELFELWNRQVRLLKNGDRKRGIFLACAGTLLAGLILGIILVENVVAIEISPGVYQRRGFRYTLLADGTAEIKGHVRVGTRLTIPEKLGNARVTVIGEDAFAQCDGLREVRLPEGLLEIHKHAFASVSIREAWLPDGLRTIGEGAFSGCSIEQIQLPAGLQRIEAYAFSGNFFSELELPEGLETLGNGALNCFLLKRVKIPDSLRNNEGNPIHKPNRSLEIEISPNHPTLKWENGLLMSRDGTRLIMGLAGGDTLNVPEGVQSVGAYAFYRDETLRYLTFPDSLREMGESAFQSCEALETVTFRNGMTALPENAFRGCSSLRECALPDTLREIGSAAFSGCGSLADLTFPETLENIGELAFLNCSSLRECVLPASLREIGSSAFSGCSSLEKCTFPDALREISGNAFSGCSSLRECTFPDTLRKIGASAFSGCSRLCAVSFPEKLESIGFYAFSSCTSLTEIVLPESLQELGMRAFTDCSALRTVCLPAGRDEAFYTWRYLVHYIFDDYRRDFVYLVYPDSWAVSFCERNGLNYRVLED